MRGLSVNAGATAPLRILCLGAHSDDIEIGCGGTLLELLDSREAVEVDWVVFSAHGKREQEAKRSARQLLGQASRARVAVHHFRDGFFPYQGAAIKRIFEQLKKRPSPDVVFTHYRDDRHQDHRVLSDLAWNTFRDHLILEYEIPKYDGDLGTPNCYIPLTQKTHTRKISHLQAAFASQRDKHWFTPATFLGLMRLRGLECRAADGYAEAFYGRKVVVESLFGGAPPKSRGR
jgi:LmbE family N-acetylglucosaminyl deacetylase